MLDVRATIADGVAAREEAVAEVGAVGATLNAQALLDEATSGDAVVDAILVAALGVSASQLDRTVPVAAESVRDEMAVVRKADPRTLVEVGEVDVEEAKARRAK